jgi:hypothetical protein
MILKLAESYIFVCVCVCRKFNNLVIKVKSFTEFASLPKANNNMSLFKHKKQGVH